MIKAFIKRVAPKKLIVFIKKKRRDYLNLRQSNKISVTREELIRLNDYENRFPKVMTTKETIDVIIEKGASICRYGDAEFDISNHENDNDSYQTPSNELTKRLHDILTHGSDDNLIICIPPFNSKTNNIKRYYGHLSFWEFYWLKKYEKLSRLFTKDIYGNSFVTRETVFYENNVAEIKKIWENRIVVFVYSEKGRFETSSSLFDNVKNKYNIHVPPVNAFEEYSTILEECKKFDKDCLFMIAAGPTAAVLAFDLWQSGYQALDIGHLPNSYDEYNGVILSPEDIPLVSNDK